MKISETYASNYLKAADLQGRSVPAVIDDCRLEHFDDESKPLLLFRGKSKGLILNKTNAGFLVQVFGDDTDAWRGQTVELYPTSVMFSGRMVDAIRIRLPAQQQRPAAPPAPTAAAPPAAPEPAPFSDDVPF